MTAEIKVGYHLTPVENRDTIRRDGLRGQAADDRIRAVYFYAEIGQRLGDLLREGVHGCDVWKLWLEGLEHRIEADPLQRCMQLCPPHVFRVSGDVRRSRMSLFAPAADGTDPERDAQIVRSLNGPLSTHLILGGHAWARGRGARRSLRADVVAAVVAAHTPSHPRREAV